MIRVPSFVQYLINPNSFFNIHGNKLKKKIIKQAFGTVFLYGLLFAIGFQSHPSHLFFLLCIYILHFYGVISMKQTHLSRLTRVVIISDECGVSRITFFYFIALSPYFPSPERSILFTPSQRIICKASVDYFYHLCKA